MIRCPECGHYGPACSFDVTIFGDAFCPKCDSEFEFEPFELEDDFEDDWDDLEEMK